MDFACTSTGKALRFSEYTAIPKFAYFVFISFFNLKLLPVFKIQALYYLTGHLACSVTP
jgi:hypothetical protein